MGKLWQKGTDILLVDEGDSPPPGYAPRCELPAAENALKYTYHHNGRMLGRYGLLRAMAGLMPSVAAKRPSWASRHKERRAAQARLKRLQERIHWLTRKRDFAPSKDRLPMTQELRTLRRQAEKLKATIPPIVYVQPTTEKYRRKKIRALDNQEWKLRQNASKYNPEYLRKRLDSIRRRIRALGGTPRYQIELPTHARVKYDE